MRDLRIGDVGLIRCVEENDRSGAPSVIYPSFELFPGGDRTSWVVRKAEINEIDALFRDFRNKIVFLRAREINKPLVGARVVRGPSMTGHHVGVDVNRVNRIDDSDTILMAKNIQNIAAIAFGTVGDKNLIVFDIQIPLAIVVFRDGVTKKLIPLFWPITAERVPARKFIDRPMHRVDHCRGERFRNIPDAAADQRLSQFRIFLAELTNSASDLRKKVAGFQFEIMLVNMGHGMNAVGNQLAWITEESRVAFAGRKVRI